VHDLAQGRVFNHEFRDQHSMSRPVFFNGGEHLRRSFENRSGTLSMQGEARS
jgi:hypothetical protein